VTMKLRSATATDLLSEDLAQVVVDRARTDKQPGADLRVREPDAGEPRDLPLLSARHSRTVDRTKKEGSHDRYRLAYFAAHKNHVGLYALGPTSQYPEELKKYATAKGTLQFPFVQALPTASIADWSRRVSWKTKARVQAREAVDTVSDTTSRNVDVPTDVMDPRRLTWLRRARGGAFAPLGSSNSGESSQPNVFYRADGDAAGPDDRVLGSVAALVR
jgi:hypothetical protein